MTARTAPVTSEPDWKLASIVAQLRHSREVSNNIRHQGRIRELPSRDILGSIVHDLSAALFPTHFGQPDLTDESIDYFVGNILNQALTKLVEQVRRGLWFASHEDQEQDADFTRKASAITAEFSRELPGIRALLASDLIAAYQGDPAATSFAEILICYPGMRAILYHRLAHALHRLGAPFIARLIADIAHSQTGIDIHPAAQIGGSFFIDHGTGVVIGETAVIGRHVRLYQAVTLGAKRFPTDASGALIKGNARHPIVEDDVVIYAGATILGRVTVGQGSVIGGNVWLTQSVPPYSVITQATAKDSLQD